mmetsp:Transcript_99295/g.222542  ORF Transcript_99295/g.222542 Transcript_99295/m.222542 type:complete len:255 (-) Transcript_99295:651-1415(-)
MHPKPRPRSLSTVQDAQPVARHCKKWWPRWQPRQDPSVSCCPPPLQTAATQLHGRRRCRCTLRIHVGAVTFRAQSMGAPPHKAPRLRLASLQCDHDIWPPMRPMSRGRRPRAAAAASAAPSGPRGPPPPARARRATRPAHLRPRTPGPPRLATPGQQRCRRPRRQPTPGPPQRCRTVQPRASGPKGSPCWAGPSRRPRAAPRPPCPAPPRSARHCQPRCGPGCRPNRGSRWWVRRRRCGRGRPPPAQWATASPV